MIRKDLLFESAIILWIAACLVIAAGISGCANLMPPGPGPTQPVVAPSVTPSPIVIGDAAGGGVEGQDKLVINSACAKYAWKDRGRAPVGYIKGVVASYQKSICRKDPVMTQPISDGSKDALAWYGLTGATAEERLLKTYTLLLGLGMRESGGKWCLGRDTSASNFSADTCEAGPFQTSANSRGASKALTELETWYKSHPEACNLSVWKEGVSADYWNCKTPIGGSGPGADWQRMIRSCPSFAAEWAAITLRTLRKHYGPFSAKAAEYNSDCELMLRSIQAQTKCD